MTKTIALQRTFFYQSFKRRRISLYCLWAWDCRGPPGLILNFGHWNLFVICNLGFVILFHELRCGL